MESESGVDGRIRVLYYSEGWGLGGIEQFIVSVATRLDPKNFRFDVFCVHDWDSSHDGAITAAGGTRGTVFSGFKPHLMRRYIVGPRQWRARLREGKFDVVHINVMNGAGLRYAKIAAKENVPVVIVHCHNTDFGSRARFAKKVAHMAGKVFYGSSPNLRLACSEPAGRYLFGSNAFDIIPNPVEVEALAFDYRARRLVRSQLGFPEEALVFGSVGRLVSEKNPIFQLEILAELLHRNVDAYLLLVGSGPEASKLGRIAEQRGVSSRIRLVGKQPNPSKYYSGLDVFSMPSLFEGLAITRIEAIANGLPCVISAHVPCGDSPLIRTSVVDTLNAELWANAILEAVRVPTNDRLAVGLEAAVNLGADADFISKQVSCRYSALMTKGRG